MPSQPKPKKVGRPALPKGHARATYLRVRITPDENRALAAVAKSKGQTVSEWVRSTINANL